MIYCLPLLVTIESFPHKSVCCGGCAKCQVAYPEHCGEPKLTSWIPRQINRQCPATFIPGRRLTERHSSFGKRQRSSWKWSVIVLRKENEMCNSERSLSVARCARADNIIVPPVLQTCNPNQARSNTVRPDKLAVFLHFYSFFLLLWSRPSFPVLTTRGDLALFIHAFTFLTSVDNVFYIAKIIANK